MDMHSREQYLAALREDYRRASKEQKTRLLNEARRRTRLNRKVLIRKLAHPARAPRPRKRGPRRKIYGAEVQCALIRVWEIFDFACGQRLAPALRQEVERLCRQGELRCSEAVAEKLTRISPRTIDRLLGRERQVRCLRRGRQASLQPLLYQKIPVKVASEWDTAEVGNVQLDYVGHCGRSTGGEYLHTISAVDIASSWWEGEPILGRSQQATEEGLEEIRRRLPFRLRELHPDNDTGMINALIWGYCRRRRVKLSRSRPYQKNDNAWVEQRNWTHVRQVVGYRRLETAEQQAILRELYAALRLYKNFFQPVLKLKEKVRVGGRIQRRYEPARTPYQRLLDSGQLTAAARRRLEAEYAQLNVAQLRRTIQELQNRLWETLAVGGDESVRPRRRGPAPSLSGVAHKQWMRRMLADGAA